MSDQLTIGQEFALRWLKAKYVPEQHGDMAEAFTKIAEAVDEWADSQQQDFDSALRKLALDAVNGQPHVAGVNINAESLLRSHSLVRVAADHLGIRYGIQPPDRFPT